MSHQASAVNVHLKNYSVSTRDPSLRMTVPSISKKHKISPRSQSKLLPHLGGHRYPPRAVILDYPLKSIPLFLQFLLCHIWQIPFFIKAHFRHTKAQCSSVFRSRTRGPRCLCPRRCRTSWNCCVWKVLN